MREVSYDETYLWFSKSTNTLAKDAYIIFNTVILTPFIRPAKILYRVPLASAYSISSGVKFKLIYTCFNSAWSIAFFW